MSTQHSEADWVGAACRNCDPGLWFADDRHRADVAEALTICRDCPITEHCLQTAMAEEAAAGNFNRQGVRGGLTALQRRRRATGPQTTTPTRRPNP